MITFRSAFIFIIGLLGIVVATIFVETRMSAPAPSTPVLETSTQLTQATCKQSGGTWNDCGSACRETPGETCIQVCVPLCECRASDECPSEFVCTGFMDGVGVCKK